MRALCSSKLKIQGIREDFISQKYICLLVIDYV